MKKKEFTARMLENCLMAKITTKQKDCEVKVFLNQNRQIRLILEKGFLLPMPAKYEVTFYDGISGILKCICELREESTKSGSIYAKCEVLDLLDKKQRRNDVKVPFEKEIIAITDQGEGWFNATIKNISAGGVFFVCESCLENGKRVDFSLEIPKKTLLLIAEVVWGEKVKEGCFGYGCKFIGLPENTRSTLRNYVYQLQREMQKF